MRADRLKTHPWDPALTAGQPDFVTLLGRLSDAIAIVTVALRSLEAQESAHVGEETVTLRHGLSLLRAAYSGLDLASGQRRRTSRGPR